MVITMYKLVMVAYQPGNCGKMGWLISLYFTVARQQWTHLIHVFNDTVLKYRIYLIILGRLKTFIPANQNLRALLI